MDSQFVAKITHLSHKGFGIAPHPSGIIYFVKGAWPGDECELEITERQHKNERFGYAKIVKIFKPSPNRIDPPCPHLGTEEGKCSGCPWMIASYEAQLNQKEAKLSYIFKRFGIATEDRQFNPILASPKTMGYRNRAQLKTDGNVLGYVSKGTNTIAPIEDCIILNDHNRKLLEQLKAKLPNPQWQPKESSKWNSIEIDDEMKIEDIAINKSRPFKQGNTEQNEKMQNWLAEKLSHHDKSESILELFCGDGNFTEVIANVGFQKILAVEMDETAVEILKKKNLPRVSILNMDLFATDVWPILATMIPQAQILVLDPPRAGLKAKYKFLERFSDLKTIYYISCDMDSFARDAKHFLKKGWKLTEIQPVDLFPHTPHVELLTVFTK